MQLITIRMGRGILFVLLYAFLMPFCAFYMQAGNVLEPPQATVSGTVTDTSGNPLAGVNLVVESKHIGTMSDLDGSFTINASPSDVLIFSMVGFKTLTLPIAGREEVFVTMEEDVTVLGEVVLNAGYYTVSEKERSGSIEKISAVDIEKQPISNPLASLQGRMAGVEVVQSSGVPGAGFNIRIRGRNSIRGEGNQPLYIVDGVPFGASSLGESQASGIIPGNGISPLNNINPMDIEHIEVLKDADATAIYGSRGANGVVLITTKKGVEGTTKVQFNILSGLGAVTNMLDVLNTAEYLEMRREAFANDDIDPIPSHAYDVNGAWDPDRQTDWQKVLFGKTSYLTNIQGSISGGSELTQFLVSGNYHKQTSPFYGDFANDKISVLGNINHRSDNGKLNFQLSSNFTVNKNDLPSDGILVLTALTLPPNAPELFTEDGQLNWEDSTWSNPLASFEGVYRFDTSTLISNAKIGYSPFKGLDLTTSLGYTEEHLSEINTMPSTIYDPAYGIGPESSYAIHNSGNRTSWIIEPQLTWSGKMGGFDFQTLAGLTFQESKSNRFSQFALGFTNNNFIENASAASNFFPITDEKVQYRYHAIYGRVNLNLKGKYILNLTGRRDGSSRFGDDRRFANFGAVGASWIFSEEDFFDGSWLSFGKLRASYGTSGNDQIGDYQYLDTYTFGSHQYQNTVGLMPTRLYNADFSWESNKKLEFGLELGILEDKILVSGSYYRNRSSNQLVGIPLAGTTGFSNIKGNLNAAVQNSGWEIEINSQNIHSPKFRWSTALNLTIPKNRLLSFPELEGSTYANSLVVGMPLNIDKVNRGTGVDSESGWFTFEDFNNDGVISAADDQQVVKSLDPKYYGGLSNSFESGKFKLEVLFQFTKQLGSNYWSTGTSTVGMRSNQPTAVLDRWQEVGGEGSFQRFTTGASQEGRQAFQRYIASDASISDASFIRLKTLSLSYPLTEKSKNGFDCEIFLRGQNLWTLTDYFGLDPETQNSITLPTLRFVSLGTQLTF